ncbi:MAG: RNA recognition motif domain-containing protein [Akkermansiaceae bacterium]
MSTDTNNSPKQGSSRRRRSRGGQNRSNNNSNRGNNDGRQSSGGNRSSHKGSGQSQQRRAMPTPKKTLSFWQKILKAIGLFKEPVRPPRPERRPSVTDTKQKQEPRRSKTRDARTEHGNNNESRDNSENKREPRERANKNSNRSRGGDPSTVENRRVYVGNLSYDTTESDLEELFKGVGAVRRVEIVYNRSTHRSKGYGFIEMLDIDEAKRTVEVLHDQFFMGRKITVSGAKSKDYDDAEKEEGGSPATVTTIPTLAPINPQKEEVLNLIDEPAAQASAEVTNTEVPTEEFHSEAIATEVETAEVTEEIKA